MMFLMRASQEPSKKFSLKRETIIAKLGLPPDDTVPVPASLLPRLPETGTMANEGAEENEGAELQENEGADDVPSSMADSDVDGQSMEESGDDGADDEQDADEVQVPPAKKSRKANVAKQDAVVDEGGIEAPVINGRGKGRGRGRPRGSKQKEAGGATAAEDNQQEDILDEQLFGSKLATTLPTKKGKKQAKV